MIKKIQYDKIGIISSSLCMIHCMGTPFIFIAKACTTTCCSNAPTWWLMIDYLFLIISFVAIYFTTTKELKSWINISFWTICPRLILKNHSMYESHLQTSCFPFIINSKHSDGEKARLTFVPLLVLE